jgi:hypothetical protein
VELTFRAQSKGTYQIVRHLLGSNIIRIKSALAQAIDLDTDKEDVLLMTKEASHMFERTFMVDGVKEVFFETRNQGIKILP